MDEDDFIIDEEELYRSVRGNLDVDEYRYNDVGQLIITGKAFFDRTKEPSIDRAKLRNYDPSLSKLNSTDGIVSLISENVRAIGDVETSDKNGNVQHSVDIIYDPICDHPENLAHSKITVQPEFFGTENKQKNAFKLLRIALARLATKSGWTMPPT